MTLKETIEAENARYETASPHQKRVILAKDILLLLTAEKIRARQMTYFFPEEDSQQESVSFLLDAPLPVCNCCFVGAAMVARLLHKDPEMRMIDLYFIPVYEENREEHHKTSYEEMLQEAFGEELEDFEDIYMGVSCPDWHDRYEDDKERMNLLCEHIIATGGVLDIPLLIGDTP